VLVWEWVDEVYLHVAGETRTTSMCDEAASSTSGAVAFTWMGSGLPCVYCGWAVDYDVSCRFARRMHPCLASLLPFQSLAVTQPSSSQSRYGLRVPTSLQALPKHSRPPRPVVETPSRGTLRLNRTPEHPRNPGGQERGLRRRARCRREGCGYVTDHSRGRFQGWGGEDSERITCETAAGAEAGAWDAAAARCETGEPGSGETSAAETSTTAKPSTTARVSSCIRRKPTTHTPTPTPLAHRRHQARPRRYRYRLALLKRETVLKQQRRRQTIQRHNRRPHPRLLPRHLRHDFRSLPRKHRDGVLDDRLPCSAEQLQDPWHEIRDRGFEDDEVRHLRLGSG